MFFVMNHILPGLFVTNRRLATLMLALFVVTVVVMIAFPSAVAFAGPATSDSH